MPELEKWMVGSKAKQKKLTRTLIHYGGVLIGTFLIFAAIIALTTDIRITHTTDFSSLGLQFALLVLCTYAMFVSCYDSGMRAGLLSDTYLDACAEYEEVRKKMISSRFHLRMEEFCAYFTKQLQYRKREEILSDVGLSVDEFYKTYAGLSRREIKKLKMPKAAKAALIEAKGVRSFRITPSMILRRGTYASEKPLPTSPSVIKRRKFIGTFFRVLIVSVFTSVFFVAAEIKPSWTLFVTVMIKIMAMVVNGFNGYRFGLESVVIDTAGYVGAQTTLLSEALRYCEESANSQEVIEKAGRSPE